MKSYYADVDITDEVLEAAEELAEEMAKKTQTAHGVTGIDIDAAIVGTLRHARRGATPAGLLNMLLTLIGSDHLRREVDAALAKGAM